MTTWRVETMKAKIRRKLERESERVRKEAGIVSVRDIMSNPSIRQAVLDAAGYGFTPTTQQKGDAGNEKQSQTKRGRPNALDEGRSD